MGDRIQAQDAMKRVGQPNAADILNRQQKIYFSSIFYAPSVALSQQQWFLNNSMDPSYQNISFPLVTYAYRVTGLTIQHDLRFTNSDPLLQVYALEQFLVRSQIQIRVNQATVFTSPLLPLVSQEPVPIVPGSAATELGLRNRFSNWFQLDPDLTIDIPLNMAAEVFFTPPSSLTTGATSATLAPVWPNASLASNIGYRVGVYFNGYEYKPAA